MVWQAPGERQLMVLVARERNAEPKQRIDESQPLANLQVLPPSSKHTTFPAPFWKKSREQRYPMVAA
jgi:hypothetical protein